MTKLTDQSLMPYGKHKGDKMINVPDDYFIFLYLNDKCSPEVKVYVDEHFDAHKLRK
jgi:uncharacterized protein (DUF3820 family)